MLNSEFQLTIPLRKAMAKTSWEIIVFTSSKPLNSCCIQIHTKLPVSINSAKDHWKLEEDWKKVSFILVLGYVDGKYVNFN